MTSEHEGLYEHYLPHTGCIKIFGKKFLTSQSLQQLNVPFQVSYIHVAKVEMSANPAVGKVTVDFINEKNHDCRLNYTFDTCRDILSLMAYVALNIPDHDHDGEYKKQLFKASFDVSKAFKGIEANFMTKALMENFKQSADFDLKFPFKKVEDLST